MKVVISYYREKGRERDRERNIVLYIGSCILYETVP